jgi:hypothetical protein
VRCGGDDFVDTARALFGTTVGVLKRQPGNRWKWVSVKLKEGGRVRNEIKGPKCRTQRNLNFGNWPNSAGNHLSWFLET